MEYDVDAGSDAGDGAEEDAGAQSADGMGSQSASNTDAPQGQMDVQNHADDDADVLNDEPGNDDADDGAPLVDKYAIKETLLNKEYTDDQIETIPAEYANGDASDYRDVVINGTEKSDNYLITQDADGTITIYTETRKFIIEKGAMRRIFLNDPNGDDTVVYHNVPLQTIMGGTNGETNKNNSAPNNNSSHVSPPTKTRPSP